MEPQKYARRMQEEMISEIELARPQYLISVAMGASWFRHSDSEQLIFTWANEYLNQKNKVVGFVNTLSADRTDYYFGEVPTSVPELGGYILIYRKKILEMRIRSTNEQASDGAPSPLVMILLFGLS